MRGINRNIMVGLVVVAVLAAAALLAPWLAPCDPLALDLPRELAGPGREHWLGTGVNGVDVLSGLLYGARVSLYVGVGVVAVSLAIGVSVGAAAGYFGGVVDAIAMRLVDILMAFPGILLAIAITAVTGPALHNIILALAVTGWVGYARLVRAQVMSVRERDFVTAARSLGAGSPRILLRHILPNVMAPVIVQATFGLAGAILAEASLSFLGLGAPPGTPSWGAMLDEGTQFLLIAPHLSTFPGLCIMLTVLGFNLLGDGLRDRLDPRLRLEA